MELWDLYDENGKRTGKYMKRGERTPKGYFHLCVEIWIINDKNEVLLTKRHPDKITYPLYWEATGGAASKGEDAFEAAFREAQEETGLTLDKNFLFNIGSYRQHNWMMETFVYIQKGELYPQLHLQAEEVVDAKWVSVDDLDKETKTVEGKIERFLRNYPKVLKIREEMDN